MRRPLGLACLFFILFIRAFYVCFPPALPDYSDLQGREVYMRGRVVSVRTQEVNSELQTVYTLDGISYKENSAGGEYYFSEKILCYTSQINSDIHIGSNVWVRGRFSAFDAAENPGQFDSRFYYYIQGIGASLYDGVLVWGDGEKHLLQESLQNFKNYFTEKMDTYFAPKYAGVMKAILLGDKSELDTELKQLFKEGGILHILTISGLHISMLGMGCFKILRKTGMSIKAAAVTGFLAVLFYGIMIGSQAATFRAICMFGMQMAAILTGRTYDRLTGLAVAAVLLLLEQPMYVFYSGFLLSFGAVLGVTVFPPVIEGWCKDRGRIVEWFGKTFAGGIGVFLATLPVQLYAYYEYPLYSMIVNVLVLPFLSFVVGLGAIVLAVPAGVSLLAVPFVYCCQGILAVYEWVCVQSRSLPGHCLVIGAPEMWQTVLYYGCLVVFLFVLQRKGVTNGKRKADGRGKKQNAERISAVVAVSCFMVALALLMWRPQAGFTCRFLSVGQGDCCVISYSGETYVVDCGSTSRSNVGTQILLPCLKYYGVSEVNGVFLSHADTDHMNGIVEWLENYEHSHVEIGRILLPDLEQEALTAEFSDVLRLAEERGIPVTTLAAGQVLSLGELRMEVLHPTAKYKECEDANGYSQVLLLKYQNHNILLTGDLGAEQEEHLDCGDISVLKVAHHGSKYSSSEAFLETTTPEHAVFSYGVGNSYGHPHSVVVERLKNIKATLWYTGQQGAIKCSIKDNTLIMESFPFR